MQTKSYENKIVVDKQTDVQERKDRYAHVLTHAYRGAQMNPHFHDARTETNTHMYTYTNKIVTTEAQKAI